MRSTMQVSAGRRVAVVEPTTAVAAAKIAVALRRPLMRLAVFVLVAPLVLCGSLVAVAALAVGAASASDQVCDANDALAQASLDNPYAQAATDRGLGTAAVAALGVLAGQAQQQHPSTLDAAGPYRLPAAYAAGRPDGEGRWRGPVDPSVGHDSRSDPRSVTAAVVRRLTRTNPLEWAELRRLPIPSPPVAASPEDSTDEETATARLLPSRFAALLTAAFPHVSVAKEQIRSAFVGTARTTSAAGDGRSGGTVIIGDPAQVDLVAEVTGPRLFGGVVTVHATSGSPSQITAGADRDLAAATGLTIAVSAAAPSPEVRADVEDAAAGRVVWFAATGAADPANGVWVASSPAQYQAAVSELTAEQDPSGLLFAVCDVLPGGGGLDETLIDPATIAAPDPAAATAIAYARAQIGKPYVTDPPRARPPTSWDCSKLTAAAWAQAGVRLTAYSFTQRSQTQPIPQSMVAPGDLVFWLRGGVHHVALVDEVTADGTIWITEAANPDAGVRRRAIGGSWDATYLTGYGRVTRS